MASCQISLACMVEASVAVSRALVLVAVPTEISPASPDDGEALILVDGLREAEGESEAEGERDRLELELGLIDELGLRLAEGDSDALGE